MTDLILIGGCALIGGFIGLGIFCAIDNWRNGRDVGSDR